MLSICYVVLYLNIALHVPVLCTTESVNLVYTARLLVKCDNGVWKIAVGPLGSTHNTQVLCVTGQEDTLL